MKKFLSFLLAFAMVFSLSMPAVAAEGDTYTLYVDIGQVADSTKEVSGVWLWANDGSSNVVNNAQMSHVSGTVYSYSVPSNITGGRLSIWYTDGTSSGAGYFFSAESTSKNLYTPADENTGTWSAYGSAGGITGGTTGDVSASYTPTVANITGVSITVDGTEYTSGNVTVYSDSEVTVTVTGTNLDRSTADNMIVFAEGISDHPANGFFAISDDGTTATHTASAGEFIDCSNFEITYYNDYLDVDNRTEIHTGIFVTYDNGTAPDTKTIYFDNTEGWSTVYAYAWDDSNAASLGTWPGSTMTKVEGEESIYAIEVPTDAVNIIFNNGSSQTGDQTIPTDDKNLYTYSTNEWSVYGGTTEPTVEAKWGTDVDNLTESGTLAEAIAAAEADSGITYIQLQSDVTTDAGHRIRSGVFTLDLNGKTLSSASYTLDVSNSGTVVTLTDTAAGGKVTTGDGGVAVSAASSGKVVINGGSYSGTRALSVSYGGVAEIKAGTFAPYALFISRPISVDDTSSLTITGGTFTAGWSSLSTMGTTTITGGTFTAGSEGHITYMAGTLDLSGYDTEKLNGLTLSQCTGAELTVSDENIKLPAGYVFQDGETTVTTLAHETVYTIAAETTEPTYTITISSRGEGTVEVPATAAEGETVTVTLNPAEGYTVLKFYVLKDLEYFEQESTKVNDNTYTFVMPAFNVLVSVEFCLPGTTLDTIYYKGPWTNVRFEFINSAYSSVGVAVGTMKEAGIYAVTPVPEWSYSLNIRNLEDTAQYINCGSIPTDGSNMYNAETGQWETYTPSQPPAGTTSAEIVWGSMSFTYYDTIDETTGEEKGWSNDGSEGAGTVTVTNTGNTTFTAQPVYTAEADYDEIEGKFYNSADPETPATMGFVLDSDETVTFILRLVNKPEKAIPAGTKIGTVTITIQEGAPE